MENERNSPNNKADQCIIINIIDGGGGVGVVIADGVCSRVYRVQIDGRIAK